MRAAFFALMHILMPQADGAIDYSCASAFTRETLSCPFISFSFFHILDGDLFTFILSREDKKLVDHYPGQQATWFWPMEYWDVRTSQLMQLAFLWYLEPWCCSNFREGNHKGPFVARFFHVLFFLFSCWFTYLRTAMLTIAFFVSSTGRKNPPVCSLLKFGHSRFYSICCVSVENLSSKAHLVCCS